MQEWLADLLKSNYSEAIDILHDDFKIWCENLLLIPDKESGDDIPFRFLPQQDRVWEVIREIKKKAERWKVRILKARQQGLTTEILALDLWEAWKKRNRNSYVLTDRDELTEEKFIMLKNFYYGLPPELRPAHHLDNRGILYLNSKDKLGLNSKIRMGTVKSKNKGVGMTVYLLHLAEYARYFEITNVSQLMTDLLKAMPKSQAAGVIIETTAYPGGFEKEWFEDKTWTDVFIPFIADPGYRRKLPYRDYAFPLQESEEMDTPEWHYGDEREEYGLIRNALKEWKPKVYSEERMMDPEVDRQLDHEVYECLAFRRWAIDDECGGKKSLFRRDYPVIADQAFDHVGKFVFDRQRLKAQEQLVIAEPPSPIISVERPLRLSYSPPTDYTGSWWRDCLRETSTGPIYLYLKPRVGQTFVLGGDTSEGYLNSDDFSIRALLCPQRIECLAYDGIMDPYDYADMMYAISMMLNYAMIGIERNASGLTAIRRLQDNNIHYPIPNMYRKKILDRIGAQPEMRYGWHSNSNTKPLMVVDLRKKWERGELTIVHPLTFEEMQHYCELPEGKEKFGGIGMKDDGVSALMIANMMSDELYFHTNKRQEHHGQTLNDMINNHRVSQSFKPWGGINNA